MLMETLFTLEAYDRDIDVHEWSIFLGLEPIQCCRYGQKIPVENSRSISTSSYWTFGIKRTQDESIDSQVSKVLNILHPKADEIKQLITKFELESGVASFLWIGEEYDFSELDLHLEPETIQKLADIKADYVIRLY
jgi:hypothetical protein